MNGNKTEQLKADIIIVRRKDEGEPFWQCMAGRKGLRAWVADYDKEACLMKALDTLDHPRLRVPGTRSPLT